MSRRRTDKLLNIRTAITARRRRSAPPGGAIGAAPAAGWAGAAFGGLRRGLLRCGFAGGDRFRGPAVRGARRTHKKAPTIPDRGAGALREAAIGAVSAAGRAGALSGERLIGAAPGQKNSAPGTVCEMPGAQCHLPEGWQNGILKISRGRGGRLFNCLYHTSRRRICHPTAPQRAETDGRKGLYQE